MAHKELLLSLLAGTPVRLHQEEPSTVSREITGKSRDGLARGGCGEGGGYVNSRCCKTVVVQEEICTADLELLTFLFATGISTVVLHCCLHSPAHKCVTAAQLIDDVTDRLIHYARTYRNSFLRISINVI